jgi:hypothetical protein
MILKDIFIHHICPHLGPSGLLLASKVAKLWKEWVNVYIDQYLIGPGLVPWDDLVDEELILFKKAKVARFSNFDRIKGHVVVKFDTIILEGVDERPLRLPNWPIEAKCVIIKPKASMRPIWGSNDIFRNVHEVIVLKAFIPTPHVQYYFRGVKVLKIFSSFGMSMFSIGAVESLEAIYFHLCFSDVGYAIHGFSLENRKKIYVSDYNEETRDYILRLGANHWPTDAANREYERIKGLVGG